MNLWEEKRAETSAAGAYPGRLIWRRLAAYYSPGRTRGLPTRGQQARLSPSDAPLL